MRVPFNDLKRQYLVMAGEIHEALQRVASSGWYIMGPEHDAFEREFAAYCGRPHAIAVGNGTDALELALRCAECGPGDEVITAANAGGYTTTAAVLVGATPVYADVDPATLTLSPESVACALSNRTKAVVITHLFGQLGDVEGIRNVIGSKPILLIEDCAQAHGAMANGIRAGAFGDLGTFSFYPTKNLGALGDGGAIVCARDDFAERLRALRQYGWQGRYNAVTPGGRNSRMDEMQAAVLRVKLPHLDEGNEVRRSIVARYRAAAENTRLHIIHTPTPSYVGHLCVALHEDRDALRERLAGYGVDTAIHYPYLDPRQPAMEKAAWRAVNLPVSENAVGRIVSLPCFPELTGTEVDQVCAAIAACA
jgi:dTDP-4-amino-4,6-dideoxygalactose transaminase